MTGTAASSAAPPRAGLGGGAAYGIAAVGLEKAVALGIALYLPRHLGLADYGHYALLVSYLGFFQGLPDATLEVVLVARLARAGGDAPALAGRGAFVRLLVSLGGALVGLAVLALVTRDTALVEAGAVWSVGLLALAATPYRALLRARLSMGRYLGLLAGQAALAVALLALVVRAGGGLVPVLAAVGTAALGGLGAGRLLVGSGARLRPDRSLARTLAAEAWPLTGTALVLVGAQQIVQLLLLRTHGAGEVGLLGGAQKLVEAVGLLPQALMLSVLPALSLASGEPGGARRVACEVARVLVIVVLPAAAVLALWAEPVLVGILGRPFAAAAPVLRMLAPLALLNATGGLLTSLLLVVGLQGLLLRLTAVSAAAMVGLALTLVPGEGARGVALALVLAFLAGQVALIALPATRVVVWPVLRSAMGALGIGVLVGAGVLFLDLPLATGAPLLGAAYAVALLLTGAVTRADLARWRA